MVTEADGERAVALLEKVISDEIEVVLPRLFYYEVFDVTRKLSLPVATVRNVLRDYEATCFRYVVEDEQFTDQALAMCQKGNPKSGYPSFYDCTYHALAIGEKCDFITADSRYFSKAKSFGHVRQLADLRL